MTIEMGFDDRTFGRVTASGGALQYEGPNVDAMRRIVDGYLHTFCNGDAERALRMTLERARGYMWAREV